jgi:peptidoglycan hydrolase-like protein with peptidoglycan-binding domain
MGRLIRHLPDDSPVTSPLGHSVRPRATDRDETGSPLCETQKTRGFSMKESARIAITAMLLTIAFAGLLPASSTAASSTTRPALQAVNTVPYGLITRLWRDIRRCGSSLSSCSTASRLELQKARSAILCPGTILHPGRAYTLPAVGTSPARSWATALVQMNVMFTATAHIAVDGRYGPATRAAVKVWQRNHGLHADGLIGNDDWIQIRWAACGD